MKNKWTNHQLRATYISIHKNASSALKPTLVEIEFNPEKFYSDNYYNFTFIRQPFDRFVSGFIEVLKHHRISKDQELAKKFYEDAFVGEIPRNELFDIVDKVEKYEPTRPQVRFLEKFNIKEYFLFERLPYELNRLERKLGVKISNPRTPNVTNRRLLITKHYIFYLLKTNPKLFKKINEVYEEDWELYKSITNRRRLQRLNKINLNGR